MKKTALFLVLTVLLVATASCKSVEGDPFAVLCEDFTVSITAVCEGNPCAFEYSSRQKSAAFTSPSELSGYILRLDGSKVLLSYEDTEIEVSRYAGRLILICDAVFSADADEIKDITAKKCENGTLTAVKTDTCEYLFASDGTPVSVSGYLDGAAFELTLDDFRVEVK